MRNPGTWDSGNPDFQISVITNVWKSGSSKIQRSGSSEDGSDLEELAAKEVRRYIYLRAEKLLEIKPTTSIPTNGDVILIANNDSPLIKSVTTIIPPPGGFIIKSMNQKNRDLLTATSSL